MQECIVIYKFRRTGWPASHFASRRGVVSDKQLALYPAVLSSIPAGSSSLMGKTLSRDVLKPEKQSAEPSGASGHQTTNHKPTRVSTATTKSSYDVTF